MKRTWRFGLLRGQVVDVMKSASSLGVAARALGVDKSAVFQMGEGWEGARAWWPTRGASTHPSMWC